VSLHTDAASEEELTRYLLELGRLLLAAGDSVTDIEQRLTGIGAAWGRPEIQVVVLPGWVMIATGPASDARLITTVDRGAGAPRLDQVSRTLEVARATEAAEMTPAEALAALARAQAMPNRYSAAAAILGQVVVVVGIALLGRHVDTPLSIYVALGLIAALMGAFAVRHVRFSAVLPVATAAVISAVAFALAGRAHYAASVQALIPPLVPLLPGALLTMAVVDLASGETVAGASRFIAGLLQLALLAFGIFAGAALVGVHAPTVAAPLPQPAAWVSWLGVVVFSAGIALQRSVAWRTMPSLVLVLLAAHAGQLLGERLFGPELSGFLGGLVAALLAQRIERLPAGPPALVVFLPAFWLLVPGAVGLLGVSQLVSQGSAIGLASFLNALIAILAIALGILVGERLTRSSHAAAPV